MLDSGARSFPDHVWIEDYRLGSHRPHSQELRPYTNDILGVNYFGQDYLHKVGLLAIYQNYGARVAVQTVNLVKLVEASLPLSRQALFMVNSRLGSLDTKDVKGLIRVFDGSIYDSGLRRVDNPALPLEKILSKQFKSTLAVNEKRNEGADVFEIGKYFLDDAMDPSDLRQVRQSVLLWLIDYLESRGTETLPKSYFFVHVASRTHLIAYQRFFGFQKVPAEMSKGLGEDEHILMISGEQLYKNLKKITSSQNF